MGREIRRVPEGWEHPKDEDGRYRALYDEDYESVIEDWIENHNLWLEGDHPDQLDDSSATSNYKYFAEWDGNPPNVEYYRPKWKSEEMTHYQVYETVTEGTPVTPAFATKEELVDYLVEYGDNWSGKGYDREVAEAFVKIEWAPSMIMTGRKIYKGDKNRFLKT